MQLRRGRLPLLQLFIRMCVWIRRHTYPAPSFSWQEVSRAVSLARSLHSPEICTCLQYLHVYNMYMSAIFGIPRNLAREEVKKRGDRDARRRTQTFPCLVWRVAPSFTSATQHPLAALLSCATLEWPAASGHSIYIYIYIYIYVYVNIYIYIYKYINVLNIYIYK